MSYRWGLLHRHVGLLLLLNGIVLGLAWGAYHLPRTTLLPIDTLPVLLPMQRLHEPEGFADRYGRYRWTMGDSVIALPNPGGAPVLDFVLAGGPGRMLPLTIETATTTFSFLVHPEPRYYDILLPPQPGERIQMRLRSSTIEERGRILGIVISTMFIVGGGAPPWSILVALLIGTIGATLLFAAHYPWKRVVILVLLLQGGIIWWQAIDGWRYALLTPLMFMAGAAMLFSLIFERLPISRRTLSHHHVPTWHYPNIFMHALLFLPIFLFIRLWWLGAPDPVGDLELSARRMGFLSEYGLAGAYHGGGDYMPLRLMLLFGLSYGVLLLNGSFFEPLPPPTLFLIKLPSLLADFGILFLIANWSYHTHSPRYAILLPLLYTLSPPIWINVAWWGQVDALLMLPMFAAVLLLDRAGGRWSWVCWGIALLIKPQAIILAPLIFVATLRLHGSRGVADGGLCWLLTLTIGIIPLAMAEQMPGLVQAALGSVGRFPKLTAGAYNLWYLVTLGKSGPDIGQGIGALSFRTVGLILVGMAAIVVAVALAYRADAPTRLVGAAILALSFFFLPTQIHERYLFFSLAFLVCLIAWDVRMVIPYMILVTTATLNIFGDLHGFLPTIAPEIAASPLPFVCAILNAAVLMFLFALLIRMVIQPERYP